MLLANVSLVVLTSRFNQGGTVMKLPNDEVMIAIIQGIVEIALAYINSHTPTDHEN